MLNHYLAAIKFSAHSEQVGFWILFVFVVLIDLGFALSLGFDICGDPANDPQPPLDSQQAGKQFDHIPSYICKFITLFKLYVCIATLIQLWLVDPIVA